jgi:hypothetical protein
MIRTVAGDFRVVDTEWGMDALLDTEWTLAQPSDPRRYW